MTLRIDDINGLENVQPENFADDEQLRAAIDGAVEQGRQGWGVKREQAYLLQAARQLRAALVVAGKADEAQRALKGEQMSHGRTKAQLKKAKAGRQELTEVLNAATLEKLETTAEIIELQKTVERANRLIAGRDAVVGELKEALGLETDECTVTLDR